MSWNTGKVCNTVWTTSRQSKHFHWKVSFLLFSLGLSHFLFFSPRLYNICFFANEQKYLSTKIQDKFYVIHISIKLQSFNNNTSGFLMLNFQMIATIRWKVSDVFFIYETNIHPWERKMMVKGYNTNVCIFYDTNDEYVSGVWAPNQ